MWQKIFRKRNEEGIALVEVLIAASMVLVLLIASAQAFSSAFGTSVTSGNRTQAISYAQEVIAISHQAPFNQVGLTVPTSVPSQCSTTWSGSFNGSPEIINATAYPGLVYCQTQPIVGTDQVFVIYTNITQVPSSGFDNSSISVNTSGTYYIPRRVTVTVTWFDSINQNASSGFESLSISDVRTPNLAECIPPGVNTGPTNPSGCG